LSTLENSRFLFTLQMYKTPKIEFKDDVYGTKNRKRLRQKLYGSWLSDNNADGIEERKEKRRILEMLYPRCLEDKLLREEEDFKERWLIYQFLTGFMKKMI
jgi:hypothetical protein